MVTVVLAHIAGVPVEETLLSVGPALVAAVSVGLVHIRSMRDRPSFPDDESLAGPAEPGVAAPERGHPHPDEPVDPFATAPAGGRDASTQDDEAAG